MIRIRALALAVGAAVALAALPSCGETSCAIPECAEPLRVALASRCWPDGTYVVSGTADGEAFAVEVLLPSGAVSGVGLATVQASAQRGLEALSIQTAPAALTVEIRLDGELLGSETYDPVSYVEHEYGGDDNCETTVCATARPEWTADPAAVARLCAVDAES